MAKELKAWLIKIKQHEVIRMSLVVQVVLLEMSML